MNAQYGKGTLVELVVKNDDGREIDESAEAPNIVLASGSHNSSPGVWLILGTEPLRDERKDATSFYTVRVACSFSHSRSSSLKVGIEDTECSQRETEAVVEVVRIDSYGQG